MNRDYIYSSDQIIIPRPCLDTLNILPREFIKVGNTEVDILEGKNAVGLINSSTIMGECKENHNYNNYDFFDYESAFYHKVRKLGRNGADFVIPDITYLHMVIYFNILFN